jgi:hypothetical protein
LRTMRKNENSIYPPPRHPVKVNNGLVNDD